MEQSVKKHGFHGKQLIIWMAALIIGGILGLCDIAQLNIFLNFIASVYTRLFKFVAVPTIALAITTTLASFGAQKNIGKIFMRTIVWTLLTTVAASAVGAILYKLIAPGNLPAKLMTEGQEKMPDMAEKLSYYDHLLSVVPDNLLSPALSGNVLSILLISAAAGTVLAVLKDSENIKALTKVIFGLQELLFAFIKALIFILPLGIVAFAAQFSAQMSTGVIIGSLGKYVAVVLGGNLLQFFVVLPLILLAKGLNPLKVFKNMLPAVLMALFTKSSAATLPVTVASAENNMKAKPEVARFILPVCCTINMNGCAAFVLVTSLFVMQNNGIVITLPLILLWILISVISAVGNAGVPMGCYFLTLSLMAGMPSVWVLGIILPIYAIIDMIETAVNVWSDSCVCAIVDKDMKYESGE